MVKDEATIKKEIKTHMEENGGVFSEWYSGITNEPEERLKQHKVTDGYITRNAGSKETAESIEDYLTNELGTKGGGGGGTPDSIYVYSYKIKDQTVEDT